LSLGSQPVGSLVINLAAGGRQADHNYLFSRRKSMPFGQWQIICLVTLTCVNDASRVGYSIMAGSVAYMQVQQSVS